MLVTSLSCMTGSTAKPNLILYFVWTLADKQVGGWCCGDKIHKIHTYGMIHD